MESLRCPHCNEIVQHKDGMPKEIITVFACRHCEELSVLFRDKIIPLKRQVLEHGTLDEKKEHLAEVIAAFLESGSISFPPAGGRPTIPPSIKRILENKYHKRRQFQIKRWISL